MPRARQLNIKSIAQRSQLEDTTQSMEADADATVASLRAAELAEKQRKHEKLMMRRKKARRSARATAAAKSSPTRA